MSKKFTTEEFVEKARKVHGLYYNYEKVNYINCNKKVTIICPRHGEFEQQAMSHLLGIKCPFCGHGEGGAKRRLTTQQFIEKAQEVHGSLYAYTNTLYINNRTHVEILCPLHGKFMQNPSSHLIGRGCRLCANIKLSNYMSSDRDTFIKSARSVHGLKYDYAKVDYLHSKSKVCIVCPIHGEFFQNPNSHLLGKGCDSCGGSKELNTDLFIIKAIDKHGDNYSYEKSLYVNSGVPVIILCKSCGNLFSMAPAFHLYGQGCPVCAIKRNADKRRFTNDIFINMSIKVHKDRYDYSKVDYKGCDIKVNIICKKCGREWQQTPRDHLDNHGCPACAKSSGEQKISDILTDNNIFYVQEKSYSDLLSDKLRRLRFDFYIPAINTLIEFDGKHHYDEFCHINKVSHAYHRTLAHDRKKDAYCKTEGITLIRIRYDEDIENRLLLCNIIK